MKGKIMSLILVATMAFSMIGCNKSDNSESKNSISIYVGSTIFDSSLDPIKGGMSYGFSFTNSALIRVNSNSEYEGDLAKDWEISDDALEYTFNLKKGIKFQDGSDFTAEDVVFTYETVKENQGNNENVDLSKLKSVEALDHYTVKFTLSEEYSPFFDSIALLGIVPSDNYDSEKFDKEPIGTGPWKVKQYDTNQQIIVEANEDYYEGEPAIKQVTFLKMDNEAAFSNAKSGQLDVVMVAPNYASEEIEGMTVKNLETMDVRNISLPCIEEKVVKNPEGESVKVGNNVTCDKNLRKALSIGINREEIIKNAYNGIGKRAVGFTSNLNWGYATDYEDNQKEEAKKLLETSGWKDLNGDGIREKNNLNCEFNVYTPSSDEDRYLLAVAVAEEAKELGIKINVKQGTWDELEKIANTDGILWGWGQYSPTVLKSLFYSDMFLKGKYDNTVGYCNEEVDKLIDEAINSNDQKVATEKWKEVQSISEEDYPYLYIVNIEHSYFVKDSLDISVETQIPHPHGHGLPIICNMKDWKLE